VYQRKSRSKDRLFLWLEQFMFRRILACIICYMPLMLKENTANKIRSTRVLVTNTRGDRVLLVRRAAGHELAGYWELPGGKLEADETALGTGLREVYEEAGVVVWPTSGEVEIERRQIPDGKHAGKDYEAIGWTAVARSPLDRPRTSTETDRADWFPHEQLGALALTPTSQVALEKLLP
jgi:8-oxo-dGTP pyrophosphatase MutT (NUDIX family)